MKYPFKSLLATRTRTPIFPPVGAKKMNKAAQTFAYLEGIEAPRLLHPIHRSSEHRRLFAHIVCGFSYHDHRVLGTCAPHPIPCNNHLYEPHARAVGDWVVQCECELGLQLQLQFYVRISCRLATLSTSPMLLKFIQDSSQHRPYWDWDIAHRLAEMRMRRGKWR